MNAIQTNYQALVNEDSEIPHESIIFHAASEGGKSQWNHIGDLDSFFRRVYNFHQKHGYGCILLEQIQYLIFTFLIVFGLVYFMNCVHFNFDIQSSPLYNKTDIHLKDLFIDLPTCAANFGVWTWLIVIMGIVALLYKCYKVWHIMCCYDDIRQFYSSAMKMNTTELSNITWHELQCRLREVQHEQQMCVHKSDLTELDIYHRILRHKNYMVAMINKNILPLKHKVCFLGDWIYFSSGLEYNIELLLFGSFSSPFKETGKLKEEYKKYAKRKEAANELAKNILLFGVLNAILAPVIFVYQLLFSFVTYSGVVKHSPSILSSRKWSLYSRLYLRHFNELDHELHARLSRAYKPSKEYMKSFSSQIGIIIARFLCRIIGSIPVFFTIWGLIKEKLFLVNNVLVIITASSIVFMALWSCVPHENAVFFPSQLMQRIIADIHYAPDHFKPKAHTTAVRDEFSLLFQYTFVSILEELVSPLVTPYILIFHLRHRALDIVDFFRSFTVDVAGVGDVCSFALMDVSKHGNHNWMSGHRSKADQHQQAEDGKTELSLIHFTLMNPHWQPPPDSCMFMDEFREKVNSAREREEVALDDPYYASLNSLSTMGSKYANLVNQSSQPCMMGSANFSLPHQQSMHHMDIRGALNQAEGPAYFMQGPLTSVHGHLNGNPLEVRATDMNFSALYLHEAHHRLVELNRSQGGQELENNGNEGLPLLDVRTTNYSE